MLEKCPFCGAIAYGKILLAQDESFFLTTINRVTNVANPCHGQPLDLFVCAECKKVQIFIPNASIESPKQDP